MDASIVISQVWMDRALSWRTGQVSTTSGQPDETDESDTTQNDDQDSKETTTQEGININSIRADKSQVWIPEIEILNRVNDFSHADEKDRQLKIETNGKIIYSRSYRMRSMLTSSLSNYPYDVQEMLPKIFEKF